LAFAESCTGGLLSKKITDTAGSSDYFKGSVVSYSNELKMKLLGVKESTLKTYGAVSHQTAKEMAQGILKTANVDLGLSITGIAGPDGGTKEKPVGLVYIGIATAESVESYEYNFIGKRVDIRERAANSALILLLSSLS
jgi:nicotinamide-nucleotide amidase